MRSIISKAIIFCLKNKVGQIVSKWRVLNCIQAYLTVYNRHPYEETITRTMRYLRERGIIDYEVIDSSKGKYKIIYVDTEKEEE